MPRLTLHMARFAPAGLLLALCWQPLPAQTVNPLAGDPRAIRAGGALFRAQCATCHGADGKGNPCRSMRRTLRLMWARDGVNDEYVLQCGSRRCSRQHHAASWIVARLKSGCWSRSPASLVRFRQRTQDFTRRRRHTGRRLFAAQLRRMSSGRRRGSGRGAWPGAVRHHATPGAGCACVQSIREPSGRHRAWLSSGYRRRPSHRRIGNRRAQERRRVFAATGNQKRRICAPSAAKNCVRQIARSWENR